MFCENVVTLAFIYIYCYTDATNFAIIEVLISYKLK